MSENMKGQENFWAAIGEWKHLSDEERTAVINALRLTGGGRHHHSHQKAINLLQCHACLTPEQNFEIFRKAAYESGYLEAKAEAAGDALEARRLLWLGHGHAEFLYGDDGEMQCKACGETWDYKRMPLENVVRAALQAAKVS